MELMSSSQLCRMQVGSMGRTVSKCVVCGLVVFPITITLVAIRLRRPVTRKTALVTVFLLRADFDDSSPAHAF